MRTQLSVASILFIAPAVAAISLIAYDPSRWGGELNPFTVLMFAVFGLLSASLWPTVLLSGALTPLVMSRVSALRFYNRLPLYRLLPLASAVGALAGIAVFSPILWVAASESADLVWNWVFAGSVAGGVTAIPIALIYRITKDRHESTRQFWRRNA